MSLSSALESLLGERVDRVTAGPPGQLGPTWRAKVSDGRRLFVKTFERGGTAAALQEADGLRFLAEAACGPALSIPRVHGARARDGTTSGLLLIDWVDAAPSNAAGDEAFGQALARLHRLSVARLGFVADNNLAGVPQDNASAPAETWAAFYRDRRLVPAFERASKGVRVSASLRRAFESTLDRIETLASTSEPPSRVHGDLWGGNRISTIAGSVLVDPAAYAGNREVDLAMMRLFGGFSRRVFDAYVEAWPLEPGAARRVPLYQLYPLLIHVVLFGESYLASVEQALYDLV